MQTRPIAMLAVTIIIIAGIGGVALLSGLGQGQRGTLSGQVDIGPFCPVQPISGCPVPTGVYSSREVVIQPVVGGSITVRLNDTGGFSATLAPGTYSLTLTNCTFVGCSSALPKEVTILPGKTTFVQISIDTGIR